MQLPPAADSIDAVAILCDDHRKINRLFEQFRLLHCGGAPAEAETVARRICRRWTIHTTIEEEIFYPEARAAIANPQLVDDANAERAMAHELIAQILAGSMADHRYAARVGMLAEYVNHHVREEQQELFPAVRHSGLDLDEIGKRMLARRLDLEMEIAAADDNDATLRHGAAGGPSAPLRAAR